MGGKYCGSITIVKDYPNIIVSELFLTKRKKGVGTRVFQHIKSYAEGHGIKTITLQNIMDRDSDYNMSRETRVKIYRKIAKRIGARDVTYDKERNNVIYLL